MRQLHIAIDSREALKPCPTGKGIWAHNVLNELQKRPQIKLSAISYQLSASQSFFWHFSAARSLRRSPPDIYLSPTSYIVPYLLGRNVKCIPVIHDLIAFDEEPHDRKAKIIERITLPRALRTAVHICTVSEATKEELLRRFPFVEEEKITVVYGGSSLSSERRTKNDELKNASQYILCVATLCPRKNQLRLIQAYEALPKELKQQCKLLLVGGRGWQDDDIVKRAANTSNVEWRGYLPQEEVQQLLQRATVFAYPSLKEGFGIPVLDALSLGIPTLTSNRSSLREIAGDAALLVDPESVETIRDGLILILTDEVLKKRLQEAGPQRARLFTWARTVDRFLEACEKALQTKNYKLKTINSLYAAF